MVASNEEFDISFKGSSLGAPNLSLDMHHFFEIIGIHFIFGIYTKTKQNKLTLNSQKAL